MAQAEQALRLVLHHRGRWAIVITLTFLTGLVTVLPGVDEYFAARTDYATLGEELLQAQDLAASVKRLRERASDQKKQLEQFSFSIESDQQGHQLRAKLVGHTRSAGCQLRRVQVNDPQRRDWSKQGNPFAKAPSKKAGSSFALSSRVVSLTVSGNWRQVGALLDALHEDQNLTHTHILKMQPLRGEDDNILLELHLLQYELTDKKPSKKA